MHNRERMCAISNAINDILSCSKNEPFWKRYACEEWEAWILVKITRNGSFHTLN